MSIVPASSSFNETVAKDGFTRSLFTGRRVEIVRNNENGPLTQPRGYRRLFRRDRVVVRPGAYDPKVTRVGVIKQAPSTVGTTMVIGGIDELKERNALYGVAGSRAAFAKHAPRKAGPGLGAYISIANTPAMEVIRTAYARTGIPVLYSKFASPVGTVPNGAANFNPIPAYTHVPLGAIVAGPTPVAQLVGTPGAIAGQSRDVGFRRGWGRTQNEGQRALTYRNPEDSPLVGSDGVYGPGLSGCEPIEMPLSHPGAVHVASESGVPSYTAEPGQPNWMSPFGRAGSDSRTAQPAVLASGHDEPLRAYERSSERGHGAVKSLFLVAAVLAAVALSKGR